jgi:DNA repair protein SbcC/Rad50
MLKQVNIKNFQSHHWSTLQFVPGINIISGVSDSGKSSVMRAIKWVVTNRPRGSAFVTYDATSQTRVSLAFDSEAPVTRSKLGAKNVYTRGKKHFKTANEVPDEIVSSINLGNINFQSQLDPHFMLQESPGNVAKQLNKIADIEIIDFVMKKVAADISKNRAETTYVSTRLKQFEDRISEFDDLDVIEAIVDDIKDNESLIISVDNNIDTLLNAISNLEVVKSELSHLDLWLEVETQALDLQTTIDEFQLISSKYETLSSIVSEVETIVEDMDDYDELLNLEDKAESILLSYTSLQDVESRINQMTSIIGSVEVFEDCIEDSNESITRYKTELRDVLASSNVCPFCGSPTNEKDLEDHIDNLL